MSTRNKFFDDKLFDEILVDCKDVYEQNMSWYQLCTGLFTIPIQGKNRIKKNAKGERN